MRVLEQSRKMKEGKVVCDRCKETVKRGEAIESWLGGGLIYVLCMDCLVRRGVECKIRGEPGGVEIETEDRGGEKKIRGVGTIYPAARESNLLRYQEEKRTRDEERRGAEDRGKERDVGSDRRREKRRRERRSEEEDN